MKKIYLSIVLSFFGINAFTQGNNWKLTGSNNADSSSFAGTTNNIPFILKSNSIEGLRLNTNGTIRIFSLDDNLTTGLVIADNTGVVSKLSLTGNSDEIFTGAGTFVSISSLTGWTIFGNTLSSGYYNVGINTTTAPEKLSVNGNILANGSISGTSINVVDFVVSGKEIKINTSVCLKGIDPTDPNSRNEICGMNGDLFVQSEQNNNYNTIINYDNTGNVGVGTNQPTTKFEVNGDIRTNTRIITSRISSNDTVIHLGDSSLIVNTAAHAISSTNQTFLTNQIKGIRIGYATYGFFPAPSFQNYKNVCFGQNSIAIGTDVSIGGNGLPYGKNTILIGRNYIEKTLDNCFVVGFNTASLISAPTFYVGPSSTANETGQVGINTTYIPTGYKLAVDGKIIAEEVEVRLRVDWPDFVFDEKYELLPLNEVKDFYKKNKHLRGMPSAKTLAEKGSFGLGEIVTVQTEKIEELTIYVVEQDEVIKKQEKQITELEEKNKLLEKRMFEIEKKFSELENK